MLGELDFAGRTLEPAHAQWSYCSDCAHFWPVNHEAKTAEKCPVCERAITKRYLCHCCYTFTLESDTPADVKNFTMTQEGVPQPGCPTCLKEFSGSAPLHEHSCEDLGATFKTRLSVCPICEQLIGGAPSFPASAMEYLNKVKAQKKVRFNYEDDLLVADEGGEFILIPNGKEHSIVLPELIRFTSKQEFYDYYENHFHCENPAPGEVIILYPAVVNKVEGGWKLKEAGRLAVSTRQPEARKVADAPSQTLTAAPQPAGSKAKESVRQEQEVHGPHVECPACHTLVKAKDMFCWKCGGALGEVSKGGALPGRSMPKVSATMWPKIEAEPKAEAKPKAEDQMVEDETAQHLSLKPAQTHTSILGAADAEPELSPKERKLASILLLTLIGLVAFGATLWLVLAVT